MAEIFDHSDDPYDPLLRHRIATLTRHHTSQGRAQVDLSKVSNPPFRVCNPQEARDTLNTERKNNFSKSMPMLAVGSSYSEAEDVRYSCSASMWYLPSCVICNPSHAFMH